MVIFTRFTKVFRDPWGKLVSNSAVYLNVDHIEAITPIAEDKAGILTCEIITKCGAKYRVLGAAAEIRSQIESQSRRTT